MAGSEPLIILVTEPRPVAQRLLRTALPYYLADDEYRVVAAGEVLEAVELARYLRPHLLVLDLELPNDGSLEILRQLRRDPLLAELPVVLISPRADELASEGQIVAALPKPLSIGALEESVCAAIPLPAIALY